MKAVIIHSFHFFKNINLTQIEKIYNFGILGLLNYLENEIYCSLNLKFIVDSRVDCIKSGIKNNNKAIVYICHNYIISELDRGCTRVVVNF